MSRRRNYALALLTVVTLLLTLNLWLQTESGIRWLLHGASSALAGELEVSTVKKQGDEIILQQLRYHDTTLELKADSLALSWQPWRLLSATVLIDKLHGQNLSVKMTPGEAPGPAFEGIILPLRLVLKEARLDKLLIEQGDTNQPLLVDSLALKATYWGHALSIDQLSIAALNSDLLTTGELDTMAPYPIRLESHWHSSYLQSERLEGTAHLTGSLHKLSASGQLAITGGEVDGLRASWEAHYQDQQITLPRISVIPPTGKGEIGMTAKLSWRAGPLSYQLSGKLNALSWPAAEPNIHLEQGEFTLNGSDLEYQLNATAALTGQQLPPSRWQLRGRGDNTHFLAEHLEGKLLGGSVIAHGEVQRSDHWAWSSKITASAINPAKQWRDWPGSLNGTAQIHGSYRNTLKLEVAPLQVDGMLRERRVSLRSALQLDGNAVKVELLSVNAGNARLQGHLTLDQQLVAELSLHAPDVAEIWPAASGKVEAQLKVSGPRQQPRLVGQLQARELRLEQTGIAALKAGVDIDLAGASPWSLTADASGVQAGSAMLDKLGPLTASLRGSGNADNHQLKLTAKAGQQSLVTTVNGSWQQPHWLGEITTLDFNSSYLGHWQQSAPVGVTLSADAITINKGCLASSSATACLAYHHEKSVSQQLQFSLAQFALSRLNSLTEEYASVNLPLSADIDLTVKGSGTPSGHAQFTLGSGTITPAAAIPTLAESPVQLRSGEIMIRASEGVITGNSQLVLASGEKLQTDASMKLNTQWRSQFVQQPIEARMFTKISDLRLIEPLLQPLEEPVGSFKADLAMSGSLSEPRLTGEARLSITQCQVPRLGLTIREAELIAKSDQPGHLIVSGRAKSGDGWLRSEGWFNVTDKGRWHSELSIKGEQLEVSYIPEARVTLSPQLLLRAASQQLSLSGEVTIDEARLEPRDLAMARRPSSDVIVINPELDTEPASKWHIQSDVRFIAADTIRLKGFGFEGYLGGNVRLIDDSEKPIRAQGELHLVAGASYRAFGQDLKAEHGRLYFADSPIDNPKLDINAVRKVGDVVAGVKVEGTAQQPILTLFSRPPMDQTDILSYLTLGRPFSRAGVNDGNTMMQAANSAGLAGGDYLIGKIGSRFNLEEARIESRTAGGEPWLVLGRYLSPRLYVRYGVGIMETGNSLIMRYQLSDQWTLQGEGGSATGADLLYSIERP